MICVGVDIQNICTSIIGCDEVKVTIPSKVNPLSILLRISFYAVSVFLIFAVTLGCFPAITVLVQSTHKGTKWGDVYFIPVCCFLLFNVGDFLGKENACAVILFFMIQSRDVIADVIYDCIALLTVQASFKRPCFQSYCLPYCND